MKMFKKYWSIFLTSRKLSVMKMLEYRADFYFWALINILWGSFNVIFYSVIIGVNQGIVGWNQTDMYLLLGVFTIFDALLWSVMYNNMSMYTEDVFSGEIIFSLLKPVDPQFFLMTRYNSYTNITRLIMGIGIVVWALTTSQTILTIPSLLSFLVTFTASLIFFYSLWFMASTCSFWVEKLENINHFIGGVRSLSQIPHQVYFGAASTVLTVLIPLGLIASVPSEMLLGRGSFVLALRLVVAAVIALFLSRKFFFFSIKRFSGVAN